MNKLCVVVPCYNEEEMLSYTVERLGSYIRELMNKQVIDEESKILFVNDGSKDNTWKMIEDIASSNELFLGLNLAANVGHQNALVAGLFEAMIDFDITISIDADLQDDITVIEKMVLDYNAGSDIVYGVRSSRKSDTYFKRESAQMFYRLMNWLGVKSVYNHADYRLMSKRAVYALSKYEERNLFLRGIVPLLGYKTSCVYYERSERVAGESKYPLKKMLSFAFDGITSFSSKPITFILFLGTSIMGLAFLTFMYVIISYLTGNVNSGWSSIVISIWFLGGLQLFAIGLIGAYLGKVYIEVKRRPRFNIEARAKKKENND